MMRTKTLATLVFSALVLAACGGSDDTAVETATADYEAGSKSTQAESPSKSETTVTAAATSTSATTVKESTDSTTSIAGEVKMTVGKKVWFKGFEIMIDDGVFTPGPQATAPKRGGDLVLNGTATNITNRGLNFGYINQQTPLSIVTKGDTFTLTPGLKDIPEGGKAKIIIEGTLEDFDEKDAVVLFGSSQVNGSEMPLGSGAATSFEPKTVTLTGTGATPSGLSVTLLSAEITSFSLDAAGGGTTTQAEAGELYIKLSGRQAYSGRVNNAIFNPALVRPDGLSAGSEGDQGYTVIDPGEQEDGFHVFTIPATVAGNYIFRFSGSSSEDKAEVAFVLS